LQLDAHSAKRGIAIVGCPSVRLSVMLIRAKYWITWKVSIQVITFGVSLRRTNIYGQAIKLFEILD